MGTEHGIGKRLAGFGWIQWHRMELNGRETFQSLCIELVESDLERTFRATGRDEVGDVAGVADADLRERLAAGRELRLGPAKLRAEQTQFTLSPVFGWRWSAECSRNGRLHGVELVRRYFEMD